MNTSSLKTFAASFFSLLCFHVCLAQQWNILGNENQISAVPSSYTTITVLGNVPYVAYVEGTAPAVVKVKRKNGVTGAWEQVGSDVAANASYTRIYSDGSNNLYVCYVDGSNGNRLAVRLYNAGTQGWDPLVANDPYVSAGSVTYSITQFSSTPRAAMAFDNNQVPYITFSERTASTGYPFVKRFVNGAWETVGGSAVSADTALSNSLALDENGTPFLVYMRQSSVTATAGPLVLYRFDPVLNTWQNSSPLNPAVAGNTSAATGSVRHTSIVADSAGNFIIAYFNTGNSNRSAVLGFDKSASSWSYIGTNGTRDAPNNRLVNDYGGNVYNLFADAITNGGLASMVRVFKQTRGAAGFSELKNPGFSRGVDSTGLADNSARSVSISDLSMATGSDTSRPFIAYTKTNTLGVRTPVVQVWAQAGVTVVTKSVSSITTSSAVAGGEIVYDGGSPIAERGIVYGTSLNPTTAGNKVPAAAGPGTFSVSLTGLSEYTLYYVRAYAVNATGVIYGQNAAFSTLALPDPVVLAPKQMEYLTRGVVAVRTSGSSVYVGWRLLGTDPASTAFNVYRDNIKLNATPLASSTNWMDTTTLNGTYVVKPVVNGAEGLPSIPATIWAANRLSIPLQIPAGGTTPDGVAYTYSANDCSVGDVNGDGEYEIFVKWDPSNAKDNSQSGYTGNVYIDCYKLDGTRLWRIDLGRNIRAGAHYTQFMVYDLDGDGKAEMACKTADATVDGTGVVIGNGQADYRNTSGYILSGPEFLTVFNGLTGAAMATTNYLPARGTVSSWGDSYGNRVDRFIAAVAYLDGTRPSLIMGRGYYTRLVRVAWDWRGGQLTHRWTFDSNDPGNGAYAGQGNHQMSVGDVDGDGKDEVLNGSSTINDNGRGLWSGGTGHGDAMHLTDMDPDLPGQELWHCLEDQGAYSPWGLRLNDAKTGSTLWGVPTSGDIGRSMAADIDSSHKGYEMWGSSGNLYDCKGNQISTGKPTYNFGIWWDGDLGRELLDGTKLDKWNPATNSLNRLFTIYDAAPVSSNNSTKANPCLTADLLGDWREEMIFRTADNTALILFTTTIPTSHRIYTLMHDLQYREAVAWQNSAYNQPPYPGFYLGYNMPSPPVPNIAVAGQAALPITFSSLRAYQKAPGIQIEWTVQTEVNTQYYEVEKSVDGQLFTKKATLTAKNNSTAAVQYSWLDTNPAAANYYRVKEIGKNGTEQWSKIVKINLAGGIGSIGVYPSPVTGPGLNVQLNNLERGRYALTLTAVSGQQVMQKWIEHAGGSAMQVIELDSTVPKGIYQVRVTGKGGNFMQRIVKN